jgi:hypothetical protein
MVQASLAGIPFCLMCLTSLTFATTSIFTTSRAGIVPGDAQVECLAAACKWSPSACVVTSVGCQGVLRRMVVHGPALMVKGSWVTTPAVEW